MANDPFEDLKNAPTVPVEIHKEDPAVVAGVQAFLDAHRPMTENGEEVKRTTVTADNEDFQGIPTDGFVKEAFVPVENIQVTDDEMQMFLKTLLTDEPTRFDITLYGGKFKCSMRTRTTFEQQRVFDVMNYQVKQAQIEGPEVNYALYMTILQRYFSLLMVERINGTLFSDLQLKPGPTVEEHSKLLSEAVSKTTMNSVRWASVMNAMRIFETKCAKMSENAANEDFWKPRG